MRTQPKTFFHIIQNHISAVNRVFILRYEIKSKVILFALITFLLLCSKVLHVYDFKLRNAMIMMFFIVSVTFILGVSSREYLPNSNNDDLINFIDLLNNRDDDEIGKSKYLQTITDTGLKKSNEQEKLVEMMRLLQKNYDAREDGSYNNDERLHFIRNPELIDEYRSRARKGSSRELIYDGDFDEDTLKQLLRSLRRNTMLRLQKEKSVMNPPVLRLGSNIDAEGLDPKKPARIREGLEVQKRVRPKLRKAEERYKPRGNFGRTSIPIVGKRGVFEDNYN